LTITSAQFNGTGRPVLVHRISVRDEEVVQRDANPESSRVESHSRAFEDEVPADVREDPGRHLDPNGRPRLFAGSRVGGSAVDADAQQHLDDAPTGRPMTTILTTVTTIARSTTTATRWNRPHRAWSRRLPAPGRRVVDDWAKSS
jgi:hypothetical protein